MTMRILQFCGRVPWPPHDGGRIAMYNLARGLAREGASLTVAALNTSRHHVPPAAVSAIPLAMHTIDIDTSIRWSTAATNLVTGDPYQVSRFHRGDVGRWLAGIVDAGSFDIIQMESVILAPYLEVLRQNSGARIVLRALNVEEEIWTRLAEEARGWKRAYLSIQARRLREFESAVVGRFDAIVAISSRDAAWMRAHAPRTPVHLTPCGIFPEEYAPLERLSSSRSVFHLGSLDWRPNQTAVLWLVREIWPIVRGLVPDARLVIGGSGAPAALRAQLEAGGAEVAGEVPDAASFMRANGVMAIPLRSGGGMRVKLIEGLALAVPIVSTSIGAEGVEVTDGEHIAIADDAPGFARRLSELLLSPGVARGLGVRGRELVTSRYDAALVARDLIVFYESLLSSEKSAVRM